jgi:hypothetical protein
MKKVGGENWGSRFSRTTSDNGNLQKGCNSS